MVRLKNINRALTPNTDTSLPQVSDRNSSSPATELKFTPKTSHTMVPDYKTMKRSQAISKAGRHRWPQATMVVEGGKERKIFATEVLSVATNYKDNNEELNEDYVKPKQENTTETKTILPEISSNTTRVIHNREDSYQQSTLDQVIESFSTKLPRFHKTLLNHPSNQVREQEPNRKLIRNIKFWQGATPATRKAPADNNTSIKKEDSDGNTLRQLVPAEETGDLQSWNAQLNNLEELNNHKFFTWHMALRERLFKHEKMHYQEAITRINKYRQRLRQRPPIFMSSPKEIQPNKDVQMWTKLTEVQGEKPKSHLAANKPAGVSMSPTQEWKPYILSSYDQEHGQRKSQFFGRTATLANQDSKRQLQKNFNIPKTTSGRRTKIQPSSEKETAVYMTKDEALLTQDDNKVQHTLPSIGDVNSQCYNHSEYTEDPLVQIQRQTDLPKLEQDRETARPPPWDLQQQPPSPIDGGSMKPTADYMQRGKTAPTQQPRTGLGAKLKLLLQNNFQPQNDNNQETSKGPRSAAAATYDLRSRLNSQKGLSRPTTRPHTFGDGSLPKIHNIVSSSLWKKQNSATKTEEANEVKHKMTLAGVDNRKSFSSSVIGISKKNLFNRKGENNDEEFSNAKEYSKHTHRMNPKITTENWQTVVLQAVSRQSGSREVQYTSHGNRNNEEMFNKVSFKAPHELLTNEWRKKNPAYRMYTSSSLLQHKHGSRASLPRVENNQNPQHTSLKLISSIPLRSEKSSISKKSEISPTYRAIKGKKQRSEKHKVLKIAVVEPPLTAKERYKRQLQLEKSSRRLTFNPTHSVATNFTAAILNSELDLRAPSSSPVDMFFRNYYNQQFGSNNAANHMELKQTTAENLNHNGMKSHDTEGNDDLTDNDKLTINQADGLKQPRNNNDHELTQLDSFYRHNNQKIASMPKVKDLVDLQRLYHVMKKHGEAYTNNGATYLYSPSPVCKITTNSDGISRDFAIKQHTNQKHLRKQPYYYYPYQETESELASYERDAPLYLVTGANALGANRHMRQAENVNTVPARKVNFSNRGIPPLHYRIPSQQQTMPRQMKWNPARHESDEAARKSQRHELTVMMPKTPGIAMTARMPVAHLEQMHEQSYH